MDSVISQVFSNLNYSVSSTEVRILCVRLLTAAEYVMRDIREEIGLGRSHPPWGQHSESCRDGAEMRTTHRTLHPLPATFSTHTPNSV